MYFRASILMGALLLFPEMIQAKARKTLEPLEVTTVNDGNLATTVGMGERGAHVLRAQILLDRAHFSPGEIDAVYGSNLRKAIAGFQEARGRRPTGVIEAETWAILNRDARPALVPYTITQEDVAGPFAKVPEDMMEKSKLPALNYASPLEGLAEKFHASPKLLRRLNPDKTFQKAGEEITIPEVSRESPLKAAAIVVDRSERTISALDAEGTVLAQYPATIGSEHDPLPLGKWKVLGVSKNPVFRYNPDLFWDADPAHTKAKVPAGPNNPVGVVWIDLSKEHYGIHGTSEPATIGRTQSHGCIRLTNWDAAELGQLVAPGTPAILQE